ncbi:Gfo/Idh/MocA family protein [Flavivirga eckloniae]|uniref:Oxidoreductase n=1 Tax=Flavivirga eckloniae TaxID=1803846 RepID=A0A2K9PM57_9FLAO|nr:Gfo/Idh/MocA family oxidoreductase [Flavivirga eckloniae]AUP78116.1 oxidoreductase [Flavivirga eckloniae]
MLKLGILGLGEGRSAISAALNSSAIELVTVCDLNEDLCKKRTAEFGLSNYTTNYSDMLNNPDIDIIAIYTPDKLHAQHIKMALQHNKHVVCTKPLIDNLEDGQELIDLVNKTGKKVFVGQSSRFFEPMIKQRKDYLNGEIGDIITVEAHYNADHRWFLEKPWALEKAFKWLYGGLSHPIDFLRWYMPDLSEVMGYGMISQNGIKAGLKNEDTMHFIFKTHSGKVARLSGCYTGPVQPQTRESEMSCIIRGTEGCSHADYMDLRYAITNKDGEEKIYTFDYKNKHYFRFEGKSHHAGEYQNYLEYFANCIKHNETPYPDIIEGIGTVSVLQAMEQTMATGLPVKIPNLLPKN